MGSQGPQPAHLPLLVTSGGHHWRPVQFYSLQDSPHGAEIWWLLQQVQSAQAGGMQPTGVLSCLILFYLVDFSSIRYQSFFCDLFNLISQI